LGLIGEGGKLDELTHWRDTVKGYMVGQDAVDEISEQFLSSYNAVYEDFRPKINQILGEENNSHDFLVLKDDATRAWNFGEEF
jgi:hypothetical protein